MGTCMHVLCDAQLTIVLSTLAVLSNQSTPCMDQRLDTPNRLWRPMLRLVRAFAFYRFEASIAQVLCPTLKSFGR